MPMKQKQQQIVIDWLKRISAIGIVALWLYIITIFINDPAPFSELVPYCMGSTMLLFGFLTAIHKGLEYWETKLHHTEKREQQENG